MLRQNPLVPESPRVFATAHDFSGSPHFFRMKPPYFAMAGHPQTIPSGQLAPLPWRFRLRRVDAPGSVGGSCKMCHQPSLATKSWIPVQTKWSWKHLIITWLSWNRRTSREFEAAPPARCLRADSHPKKNICGRQHNSNPHSNDSPFVNGFLSPQIIHFKPSLK